MEVTCGTASAAQEMPREAIVGQSELTCTCRDVIIYDTIQMGSHETVQTGEPGRLLRVIELIFNCTVVIVNKVRELRRLLTRLQRIVAIHETG